MASSGPSVETIKEGFPHLLIPRHAGAPSFESIQATHRLLKANAASVPSDLGGGTHGLLGLMLDDAVYNNVTGENFVRPANPGNTAIIPAGATSAQTHALVRVHAENLRVFREVTRTDQALKQQLLSVYDDMYFKALRNPHVGYTNATTFQLIQHLYNTYGRITQIDLSDNEKRLKQTYDPTLPIENLFSQVEEAIEYAAAGGAPFTNNQIVTNAYLLIFQTGQFERACEDWDVMTPADKTWVNFKTHFTRAHQRFSNMQQLRQANFNTNNQANHLAQMELQQDTTNALQALAAATTADRSAVANLAQSNAALTAQLTDISKLIKQLELKVNGIADSNQQRRGSDYNRNSEHYCWSHGRTRNPNHVSANCRNKKDGHIDTATLHDKHSGSEHFCNGV